MADNPNISRHKNFWNTVKKTMFLSILLLETVNLWYTVIIRPHNSRPYTNVIFQCNETKNIKYHFCHVTGNQAHTTQQTYQKQTCSQIYRVFIYSRIIYITYQCLCCLCRTAKPCHESNRPAAARPYFQYEMQSNKTRQ